MLASSLGSRRVRPPSSWFSARPRSPTMPTSSTSAVNCRPDFLSLSLKHGLIYSVPSETPLLGCVFLLAEWEGPVDGRGDLAEIR